ncbi:MAG: hypothetical protein PHG63_00225 [Candidatus Dojkabacteria bacterium]|nr:hypothetical protein [Candidatus Dojkabacteria bacterium]
MAQYFKIPNFLRYIDDDLLKQYFEQKGINITIPQASSDNERVEALQALIEALPQEKLNELEYDFSEVKEMASEFGLESILTVADSYGISLQHDIEEIENCTNQAFYAFLHQPKIFESARVLHDTTTLANKSRRVDLKKVSVDQAELRTEALTSRLSEYLIGKYGKGKQCRAEVYRFKDRACFLLYPEDYKKSDLEYQEDDLKRVTRRPSFQITYIYYPETGTLEVASSYRGKTIKDLFDLFSEAVLEDEKPVDDYQKIYELDKLLRPDFVFLTEPEDMIESVGLKHLRLVGRLDKTIQVTIDLKEFNGVKTMQEYLSRQNMHPSHYFVNQARIQVKYRGEGRKGRVTMQLTFPDKCNLSDTPLHTKTRKYLAKWGLEKEYEQERIA